jgi:hypothetical protein
MSNYKKIAEEALKKSLLGKQLKGEKRLNESVVYPENISERMNSKLEEDLIKRNHSLGNNAALPEGDDSSFEEKVMGERFSEVVKRYKRVFECDYVNETDVMRNSLPLVKETIELEKKHKKKLEELAVKMIREEFDMSEDIVEINAELTTEINIEGTKKNPRPIISEVEFENHDELTNANKEVYKRRFLNAMIQGSAKKCNHMYHMVDDELSDLDPKLPNKYSKLMANADYMYYIIPNMENGVSGGVVRVDFPTSENPKCVITAQAMVFPVLIHELVKGVMEILSAHGLPKDKKIGKFVVDKADFLAAEPWDMRLGPALWSRFTNLFEADDFSLKHHVFSELSALPVDEFNMKMKEVMANTKQGKKIITDIVNEVKHGLQEEEAMNELNSYNEANSDGYSDDEGFDIEDLMNDTNNDDSDGDGFTDEGFDIGELF